MGKTLLIYVLFSVVVSTTLETEVKENTSKLLSNSLIMFSSLTLILIMFIIITFIIICTKKVLVIVAYTLQDFCTTDRPVSCATLKLKF